MVEALGISLIEFICYLINFIILVAVLAKFLYKPFLEMMAQRRKSIEDAIANAEDLNRQAEDKMEDYNQRIANVEEEGREIIRAAKLKADSQAADIIEEANNKASEIIEAARKSIELEREQAMDQMTKEVVLLSMMAAEKIVEREIEKAGQEAIVEEVIRQARSSGWQN